MRETQEMHKSCEPTWSQAVFDNNRVRDTHGCIDSRGCRAGLSPRGWPHLPITTRADAWAVRMLSARDGDGYLIGRALVPSTAAKEPVDSEHTERDVSNHRSWRVFQDDEVAR